MDFVCLRRCGCEGGFYDEDARKRQFDYENRIVKTTRDIWTKSETWYLGQWGELVIQLNFETIFWLKYWSKPRSKRQELRLTLFVLTVQLIQNVVHG